MQRGRNHEEREEKLGLTRKTRHDEHTLEAQLRGVAGRSGVTPRQGLVGAHRERNGTSESLEEPEPVDDGAEVAPTPQAEARERERHRQERLLGRLAAGVGENLRDRRAPEVTAQDLEGARKRADAASVVRRTR